MKKLLFFACIVLVILGCGGDMDDGMPCLTCKEAFPDSGLAGESSSSYVPSSSSLPPIPPPEPPNDESSSSVQDFPLSSSSSHVVSYGSMTYGGQTYSTVRIGTQTWMAKNLNYEASGSKCYDNKPENCDIYGRLYDWETALTVCPSGWHLPSIQEWEILMDYIGGNAAGDKLKATSGWWMHVNNEWVYASNGTDYYGFWALPGGIGYSYGGFDGAGADGGWWSASESSNEAYYLSMGLYGYDIGYNDNYLYQRTTSKGLFASVRCLQGGDEKSSSSVVSSSSSVPSSSSSSSSNFSSSSSSSVGYAGSYGSVYYEGQTYKTVVIGTQTWMAENLNYAPGSGTFISCDTYDCATYGRLYDWSTAMGFAPGCNTASCSNQIQSKHQGICPSGWHMPSYDEWGTLSSYVQSTSGCSSCDAKLLKSTGGWTGGWYNDGNGADAYGFSALPGGEGNSDGSFGHVGYSGRWWSTNEFNSLSAYFRDIFCNSDYAGWYDNGKSYLWSVRCLQD